MKLNSRFLATVTGVLALAAGTAQAANIVAAAPVTYSKEGVVGIAAPVLGNATVTLRAAYAVGDQVTFTLVGPALDPASAPTYTCVAVGGNSVTFGFLSIAGQVATFRVTAVTLSTNGLVCTLAGLATTGTAISGVSSVSVNMAATVGASTTALDTACTGANCVANTAVLATVRNQFAASTTTGFDGVIDVSATPARTLFTPSAPNVLTMHVSTDANTDAPLGTNDQAALTNPGAATAVKIVLTGDFSFADANKNGTCTLAEIQAVVAVAPGAITAATCSSITINPTTAEGAVTVTVDPTAINPAASRQALKAQKFSAVVTITYNVAGGAAGAAPTAVTLDGGSWTLNGASVFVPYMPYGTGISAIIYVTNDSALDGEISVDWYDDASPSNSGTFAAGTSKAGSVLNIGPAVATGLAAGGFSGTGKVSLTIVVNSPSANVGVFSAYNVSGNRNVVVNTSNGFGGAH